MNSVVLLWFLRFKESHLLYFESQFIYNFVSFFVYNLSTHTGWGHNFIDLLWQRQWDASEKGRFLYGLKPKVTMKTMFDYPNKKLYNQIAQLRIGYAKLNDYLYKIGVSDTKNCSCGEIETIEHYLLECENYFDQRERMRTSLFHQTGIVELTTEILLGSNGTDTEKDFGPNIISALGDFITQTARF